MKEDKLSDLSMQLSVDVLKLTKELRAKHETVISNQISRSATSVCANIAESKYGHSRADYTASSCVDIRHHSDTFIFRKLLIAKVIYLSYGVLIDLIRKYLCSAVFSYYLKHNFSLLSIVNKKALSPERESALGMSLKCA